jgi:hypothetical protein
MGILMIQLKRATAGSSAHFFRLIVGFFSLLLVDFV